MSAAVYRGRSVVSVDEVPLHGAGFVEPVNTCLKAVVQCDPQCGDTVLVAGQGPIGLLFTMLLRESGARVYSTDTFQRRRELSRRFGAIESWHPREIDVVSKLGAATEGRGADLVIVAASAPGIVADAVAC